MAQLVKNAPNVTLQPASEIFLDLSVYVFKDFSMMVLQIIVHNATTHALHVMAPYQPIVFLATLHLIVLYKMGSANAPMDFIIII